MKDKTGGPAFPREMSTVYEQDTGHQHYSEDQAGMTLIDYFAAKAMHAILSTGKGSSVDAQSVSEMSYGMAKTLLKEREKWVE